MIRFSISLIFFPRKSRERSPSMIPRFWCMHVSVTCPRSSLSSPLILSAQARLVLWSTNMQINDPHTMPDQAKE